MGRNIAWRRARRQNIAMPSIKSTSSIQLSLLLSKSKTIFIGNSCLSNCCGCIPVLVLEALCCFVVYSTRRYCVFHCDYLA